jgi:hypothetical protein
MTVQQIQLGQISVYGSTLGQVLTSNGSSVYWGTGSGTTVYDFDDVSFYCDGRSNSFKLTYNKVDVQITSPWSITVSINGALQRAFTYNADTVWMSYVLAANKGYTIQSNTAYDGFGNIATSVLKFVETPPINSDIYIRSNGGVSNPVTKIYPFRPLDIAMGL